MSLITINLNTIASFYDAEGRKKRTELKFYQQWNSDYNCPPLEDIKNMLEFRNIKSNLYREKKQNNANLFRLHVEGKSRRKFLEEIPLEHPLLT